MKFQHDKPGEFKNIKEGWVRLAVTSAQATEAEDDKYGRLTVPLRLNPVTADGEIIKGGSVFDTLYLPVVNDEFPDKTPKSTWRWRMYVCAFDPNFPRYPKKVGKSKYETHTGELVDWAKSVEIQGELDNMLSKVIEDVYNDPKRWEGETAFFEIEHQVYEGKVSARVKTAATNLPAGKEAMVDNFYEE